MYLRFAEGLGRAMRHLYNAYVSGEGSYKVYHCDYCGYQTRRPESHNCRKLDLRNPPPAKMLERILDNGNDAPPGRAGMPQVVHWTPPPYRTPPPELDKLKEAAMELYRSPYTDREARHRVIDAALDYAATQIPHGEGEIR